MLKIITLFTINSIFELECQQPLSPMTKMVYINTLTHYFEHKDPNPNNLKGFDVIKSDIKNYSSFDKYYQEMQRAGIAIIGNNHITFPDVWGKYIDKKLLTKQSPEEIIATLAPLKPISDFKEEMEKETGLFELIAMKNGITTEQARELLPVFIQEQLVVKKTYPSIGQAMYHFTNWSRKDYNQKKKSTPSKTGGRKILGME